MTLGGRKILSMKRRRKKLVSGRVMLIVTEGKETEPRYFKQFCVDHRIGSNVVIEVSAGSDALTVAENAIALLEKNKREAKAKRAARFDEVWAVFDREAKNQNVRFNDALMACIGSGVKLAVSNPCFEFWLLLHFDFDCRRFSNCGQVAAELRKKCLPFAKNTIPVELVRRVEVAVGNATKLCGEKPHRNGHECPTTLVHSLIESLKSVGPHIEK